LGGEHPRPLVLGVTEPEEETLDGLEVPENKFNFVWVDGGVEDPVYTFWLVRSKNLLATECYVVFTNVEDSPAWADLERAFGGLRFGSLFLLKCKASHKVEVLPSQRGLHFK